MRTFKADDIERQVGELSVYGDTFRGREWIGDISNIALVNDRQDLALFAKNYYLPGVYCGHYFFNSRGAKALEAGKDFIQEIFTYDDVKAIQGLTSHKGAQWLSRKLGFSFLGEIMDITGEPAQLFFLQRDTD